VRESRRAALTARRGGRPIPSGRRSTPQGLLSAAPAITAGAVILWFGLGKTAGILGMIAALFYNGVYTTWLKPTSPFAAVPGAIPGAIPPVIGWVAGGGGLMDAGAVILFGILFLWQMPHFWALSLRYRADYAAGGFPMVSETVGVEGTARLILVYALGLTAWSLAAPTFGVGGPVALAASVALGARLIWLANKFARKPEDQRGWLSLFLFSNFYLLLLFLALVGERLAPHSLALRCAAAPFCCRESPRHGWRRIHRLTPLRLPPEPGVRRRLHGQSAHGLRREHRPHPRPPLSLHQARRHQLHRDRRAARLRAA